MDLVVTKRLEDKTFYDNRKRPTPIIKIPFIKHSVSSKKDNPTYLNVQKLPVKESPIRFNIQEVLIMSLPCSQLFSLVSETVLVWMNTKE